MQNWEWDGILLRATGFGCNALPTGAGITFSALLKCVRLLLPVAGVQVVGRLCGRPRFLAPGMLPADWVFAPGWRPKLWWPQAEFDRHWLMKEDIEMVRHRSCQVPDRGTFPIMLHRKR